MVSAITPHELQQRQSARCQDHQQSRQTGWDIIRHVIDMGCDTAESTITFGLIANHRVERIYHFVSQHPRGAEQQQPEQRGYHPIAQILGQGLKRCRTYLLGREFRGVAPNDTRYLCPTLIKTTV